MTTDKKVIEYLLKENKRLESIINKPLFGASIEKDDKFLWRWISSKGNDKLLAIADMLKMDSNLIPLDLNKIYYIEVKEKVEI